MDNFEFTSGYNYAKSHQGFYKNLTDGEMESLAAVYLSIGTPTANGMAKAVNEELSIRGKCVRCHADGAIFDLETLFHGLKIPNDRKNLGRVCLNCMAEITVSTQEAVNG